MPSYPAGMSVSNRSLIMLADALRQRRAEWGTKWRRLPAGRQALLVVAHLRKGETYADLARGFAIGTTTVYRYLREGLQVLAALAPTLDQAIAVAGGEAFVVLDGTLLRIDRVGMTGGHDRAYYSGKHKAHGVNVQVLADPAGRLVWASPALPGSRHDIAAAREHDIPDALAKGRDHRGRRHRLPGRRPGGAGAAAPPPLDPDTDRYRRLSDNQKAVNTAHARQRGPGERANAQLKSWKVLRKIRCSPSRATVLVQAVQALILTG